MIRHRLGLLDPEVSNSNPCVHSKVRYWSEKEGLTDKSTALSSNEQKFDSQDSYVADQSL